MGLAAVVGVTVAMTDIVVNPTRMAERRDDKLSDVVGGGVTDNNSATSMCVCVCVCVCVYIYNT